MQCPKCSYVRSPNEVAPEWQCPSCGIAYVKYKGTLEKNTVLEKVRAEVPPVFTTADGYHKRKAFLFFVYGLGLFFMAVAFRSYSFRGIALLIPVIGSYMAFTNATLLLMTGMGFSEINRGENIPFGKKFAAFAVCTAMFFILAAAFFLFF